MILILKSSISTPLCTLQYTIIHQILIQNRHKHENIIKAYGWLTLQYVVRFQTPKVQQYFFNGIGDTSRLEA